MNASRIWNDWIESDHEPTQLLLCKALYLFVLLKALLLWPVISDITTFEPYAGSPVDRWTGGFPLVIAQSNIHLYMVLLCGVLSAGLVFRLNYVIAIAAAWLSFGLTRLTWSVANGSDSVLNMLLLLSALMPMRPVINVLTQRQISNAALLLCRIQVCMLYLLSGFDKLASEAWRSGAAIHSVANLDYFVVGSIEAPDAHSAIIFSWTTILFELLFPVLVWFRSSRKYAIVAGAVFHIVIGAFLSLPDFSFVMLISYLAFARDPIQLRPSLI